MPLQHLQRFWQWLDYSSHGTQAPVERRRPRKLTRKRQAFLEPLEDRSLLASLLQTYLPDTVGPQQQAAFGYRVAAGDSYYAVGAPSSSTSHVDSGEVYVYNTAGTLVSRISNPTPNTDDNFGSAVAVFGNLVVVGAWQDDFNSTNSGRAYIFAADTGALLFTLGNPNPWSTDEFGYSVATNGSLVAVGVPGENFETDDKGEVQIYSATTGAQLFRIENPDVAEFDRFGTAVAMHGNTLIVGAPHDDSGGSDSGRAYLFNASNGALIRILENPSAAAGDQFGSAVAVAGNYAVVSAPFDDGIASDAGAVYLFDIVTGDFVRTVDHPAAAAGDQFGQSVGQHGDNLLVGTGKKDDPTNGADVGRAYLFSAANGSLLHTINNPSPQAGDEFGFAAAISAAGILIGSWSENTGATDAGLAYLYAPTTGGLTATLANPTLQAQSAFGTAMALAGDWFVVGSPGDDRVATNSGEVHVYNSVSGALVREYFAPANSNDAAFGAAVAVSGNILAVGAPGLAVSGFNAGAVLLFDLSTGLYLRTIENPTPVAGDQFGKTISFEGNRLVVGAPLDDTQETDNGAAYVFDATTGALVQTLVNPSAAAGDQFGFAVTLSGDTVAIGAPYTDDPGSNHGKVHVFNAVTGGLTYSLLPNTRISEANFGYSLDLDGTTLAVGAPFTDINGQQAGLAWLFNVATGVQAGNGFQDPTGGTDENFGYSVAVSGGKLFVGMPGEAAGGTRRGLVHWIDIPTRAFVQAIANPTPGNDDRFGDALAVDGGRLAVGATGDSAVNHREGAAYLFNTGALFANLSTGVLTITDIGTSSTLTAVRDGNHLLINGNSDTFDAAIPSGAVLENNYRTLRIPFAQVNELRFTLGNGVDSLTLDLSGGDVIPALGVVLDGGAAVTGFGDSLAIVGGAQGAVTYNYTSPVAGSILLENFGNIAYSATESLRNTGDSTAATFNFPTAVGNPVALGSNGPANLQVSAASIPPTVFDNPSDMLTFNRGNSLDTLTVGGFAAEGSLVMGAVATPFATITLASAISFAINRNLTAYAGTINFSTASSDLSLLGTGSVSLTTSRDLVLSSGASITTKDGNINLTANPSGTSTGLFAGVRVDSSAVVDAENGNVTVMGRGGASTGSNLYGVYLNGAGSRISTTNGVLNVTGVGGGSGTSSSSNAGVYLLNGGTLSAGLSGVANVTGTGANVPGSSNDGVIVIGNNSRITSGGASLLVTGTGGQSGVTLSSGGQINAGGSGDTTVIGTGGNTATSNKVGVSLTGSNTRITSAGGNVRVEGRGGGSTSTGGNNGISVLNAAQITAGGLGTVTVIGIGDYQNTNANGVNYGVLLNAGTITSSGGAVSVTGTGGGNNNSNGHSGVHLLFNALITAGGMGSVTVEGTGASPVSGSGLNTGVYLVTSQITSSGGPISVRGTAGTGSSSQVSAGVFLGSGAQIVGALTASILVEGRGATNATATGDGNSGVVLNTGRITANGGNVIVRGWGGGAGSGSGFNFGVDVVGSSEIRANGAGTITVEGFGGNTASATSDTRNVGVRADSGALFIAATGEINVTGTGGGAGTSTGNSGVHVNNGAQITTAGNITLTGTSGAGVANTVGIEITTNSARVNSSAGLIRLIGSTTLKSSTNFGIVVSNGFIGNHGSLATVELIADAMQFSTFSSVLIHSTQTAMLRPLTPGFNISLGVADVPNTSLGLTGAELDAITAGFIQIGDASSGDISLGANVNRTSSGNVALTPGLNRNLTLTGFSLTLASTSNLTIGLTGTGALTSATANIDLTASTIAITAEQGNIGALGSMICVNTGMITATTLGSFYLGTAFPVATIIGPAGLSAGGTGWLGAGMFSLGGPDRISDTTAVELAGTTNLALNGFNETFYSLSGASTTTVRNGGGSLVELTIMAPTGTMNLLSTLGGSTGADRNLRLSKFGGSTLVLGGNNTFTGQVLIHQGILSVAHPNALGSTGSPTIVGSMIPGSSLDLNGTALGAEQIFLINTPGFSGNPKLLNSNASVPASASGEITVVDTVGGPGSITLSGKVIHAGLTKVGAGVLTLTSTTNDFDGDTVVAEGELRVNGTVNSPVVVESGATVSGTGLINDVLDVRSGGRIAPGAAGAGTLSVIVAQVAVGAQVDLQFASAASSEILASTQSRFLLGAVGLGAYPTLNLTSLGGYVPTSGGKLVLLQTNLTGMAPSLGLFVAGAGSSQPAGTVLTEGMLVTNNFLGSGFPATISYVGGTGNDVVLNVGATSVNLSSGNLVINDASAAGQADNLTIVRSGADLVITDSVNPLVALPGFTQLGIGSISIPFANITGNLQVNTLAGNDSLTVDFSGGDPIPTGGLVFAGGAPLTANADTLSIIGNNLGDVGVVLSSSTSGTISVGSFGAVTFNGVEVFRQTGTAANLSLTPPSTAANTMTLEDDGTLGNGLMRLSAPSMLPMVFANPTGAVSILRGHANDALNVGTTTATSLSDLAAGLTLGTDATPLSTINIPAGSTLPIDRSFTAFAANPISFTNANSDWAASGTGAISLTSARSISFVSGSSLSVVNGDLTLSANQQAVASTGNFKGMDINGATISSSGTGNVTVLGRGGDSSSGVQYGVYVYGGGLIRGGTTGLARVMGTGGSNSGADNSGVKIGGIAPGGTITSLGANVEVIGQAGGGFFGGGANRGVDLDARSGSAATISAAGLGTVAVRGTGSTIGGESTGVRILSQPALITSAGGRVEVVGVGGSSGLFSQVGMLIQGGTISAGPGADLLVQGTGGVNSSNASTGLVLENGSAVGGGSGLGTINVNGGQGQIIGQAGGTSTNSYGIATSGGLFSAGSTGSLTITGTAQVSGFSGGDWGMTFQSALQSAGANVTLIGRGGRTNGLYFSPLTTSQLNGSSVLRLEGIHGTAGFGTGLTMGGLIAPFTHTGNGGMQIITDRLTTASGAPYVFANGSISIDTYTPGVPMTLGSFAPVGLRLDDFFLTSLTPATLNIGSATSGQITVNSTIHRSGPEQMNLTSGGGIEFAMGGAIRTPSGSLKLSPGAAGFTPASSFPDVTVGSFLTFTAGSQLNIVPTGGLSQTLDVSGGVDLTGVSLVVSGFEALAPTQPLIVVDNDGTDPIIGAFTGLPEGTIVNVNGLTRKLTYVGGTGNDVELIYNRLPTLNNIPLQTVLEDSGLITINLTGITPGVETQALQVTAANNLSYLLTDPVVSYTSPNTTGTLTFTPKPDQFGAVVVTVTVRDAGFDGVLNTPDDGLFTPTFNVSVTPINDPPSFVKGADVAVAYGATAQSQAAWATAISAGPNELGQAVTFNVTSNTNLDLFAAGPAVAADGTLTFTPATGAFGTATITLVARDDGGTANGGADTSATQTFTITVNPPPTFQVTKFVPTSTGGVLNFSRDLDQTTLNLYDIHDGSLGAADIVFLRSGGDVIKGSAIVDSNRRRITFVATNGRLPADDYTLTLRSATNGFRDLTAEQLDGDADGVAGGNYMTTFTVAPDALGMVAIRLPNFSRGPLQPVNLPANSTSGLPISFSDGGGITSANFELRYNPAILTISGAAVAPGLPEGANVIVDTSTPGVAVFQFTSPEPLAAGTTRFIDLQAAVPNGSTYLVKQVLDLRNIVLNGGTVPAADDDAVHVNAYFGDTTGNGSYSGQDATLVSRLAVGLGNGVQVFKLLDPVIIADITGSGGFSGSDTTGVQRVSVVLAVNEIPALPLPAASFLLGGPDPKLSIPQNLAATAGGQLTIPVHIDSIVDLTGDGLESGELVIYYDATVFDVRQVALGSLFQGLFGWTVASRIDALAGRVFISFSGHTPLEGFFQGELVQLHAQVKPDAAPGPTAINLAAAARDAAIATQLNEGWLTLIPAPTDAANDPGVDGMVNISRGVTDPQTTGATARLVGNELRVTGTNGDDRILVAMLGTEQVRVRAGAQILGTFAAPTGILIDALGGNDRIYAAPSSIPTVIAAHHDEQAHDEIFAGKNSLVVDRPTSADDAAVERSPAHGPSNYELALLQMLADWSAEQANAVNSSGPTRSLVTRRR